MRLARGRWARRRMSFCQQRQCLDGLEGLEGGPEGLGAPEPPEPPEGLEGLEGAAGLEGLGRPSFAEAFSRMNWS